MGTYPWQAAQAGRSSKGIGDAVSLRELMQQRQAGRPQLDSGAIEEPRALVPGVPPFAFDQARIRELTVDQVAGIIFNENRDVTPGESTPKELQDAKVAQAHAVINGDRKYGKKRQDMVGTAPWRVADKLKKLAQYQQALEAARTAYQEDNLGIDPTGGRIYFNNRFEHDDKTAPRVINGRSQDVYHPYGAFSVGGGRVWTMIYDDFKK